MRAMGKYRRHPDLTDEEIAVLSRVELELKLRGYSRQTRKSYMGCCRRFLQWKRGYRGEGQEEVRSHLEWLLDRGVSRSAFNAAYSALRFLYREVLMQPASLERLRRPRGGRQLPEILSQREVLRILDSLRNPKHRLILALLYAGGLRVGEVVRLKVSDIDSDRMLIRVRQGKGRKTDIPCCPGRISRICGLTGRRTGRRHGCTPEPGKDGISRNGRYRRCSPVRSPPQESASG